MLVIGITNKLPRGLRLFMWEYDNIEEFDVLEDANFISTIFDIDIYILKSSEKHYHLISFDILTIDQVQRIQEWVLDVSDYLRIKETPLYDDRGLWNTLRVSNKGKTASPIFLKVFLSPKNKHLKSIEHYRIYQYYCGIPKLSLEQKPFFVNFNSMTIAVYNTGIGAKCKRDKI